MGALTNVRHVLAKMFGKTERPTLNTIVPMTAKEGIDKILSTSNAIDATIPLNTEQSRWLETLCETVDWSKQNTANAVVQLENYTVIMTITQNHLMFDGSALLATMNGTPNTGKG